MPMKGTRTLLGAALLLVAGHSANVVAQWPKYRELGVPRDVNGKVRNDAPAPRTTDGKPDFSGVWRRADRDPLDAEAAIFLGARRVDDAGPGQGRGRGEPPRFILDRDDPEFAKDAKSPPLATFFQIGANLPGGLPMTPWAEEIKKQRMATNSKDNPDAMCLPMGITQFHMQPQPRKIVQTPKMMIILNEANYGLRYIYTDGRKLPPLGEPQPWWYGYSVGHWEGDTLVVESNNFRGAEDGPFDGWLDLRGSPYSRQVKITERFRRPIFGKLEIDVTVDDPKAYKKPFTVRINQSILVDEELIEFICNENQQFKRRVKVD